MREDRERTCAYYYVTGASRGLGRAIVERLLDENDTRVIGIARGDGLDHPRYRHVRLDLKDLDAVAAFEFDACEDAARIVLVNNAAQHKPKQLGYFHSKTLIDLFAINAVAPILLMNSFIARYSDHPATQLVICNITSSSALTPVRGSSAYCASKAALEMATRTALLERDAGLGERLRFLIADPGGMDSDMWTELGESSPKDLPDVEAFHRRRPVSPADVAARLCPILLDPTRVLEPRILVQGLPTFNP